MSGSETCSCSLQARLHQVENARSREMKAHGELVQKLERELEARRTSEAELRLVAAKLRTDNCRLEAELCATSAKVRQLLDQLDQRRAENAKREDELKSVCEATERRLQAARDKNEQLLEEKRQLAVELSDSQKQFERAGNENKLLSAKIQEQCLQSSAQTAEIDKLSALVTSRQQELDASAGRTQLLLGDLSTARSNEEIMQERLRELERNVSRALVTRNRVFRWKQKDNEMLNNRHLGQGFFLAWKMIYVQARMCNAVKMAQHNECTRARLRLIEQEVRKRCALLKSDLNDIRLACTAERSQVQSLCEDVCQPEMPKLIELVENQRRNFSNQMRCLEAQLENQREHSQNQEERLKMAQQDADLHARMILEDHQAQLRNQKLKKHIISQALAALKRRESQRRTFNAWKEIYLRSLVGQATHTAMVFRSQHPQVASTVECGSPRGYNPSLPSAAILPAPAIAIQSLQSVEGMKVGADSISRSPVPDDTLWRKWRRVDAGTAGRGLKPRPITRALPS